MLAGETTPPLTEASVLATGLTREPKLIPIAPRANDLDPNADRSVYFFGPVAPASKRPKTCIKVLPGKR
jgi:hypothetical protein